jgi:hypothetical protein
VVIGSALLMGALSFAITADGIIVSGLDAWRGLTLGIAVVTIVGAAAAFLTARRKRHDDEERWAAHYHGY